MKRKHLLSVGLLSAILMGAIAPVAAPSAGRTFIESLSGNVQIKRFWFIWVRVDSGELLQPDDKLRVRDNQSSASVLCNGQTRWPVPIGREVAVSEGCHNNGYRIVDPQAPSRGSDNQNLPYLIRSRNTAIFPNSPLILEWHPVAGATHYDVEIKDLSKSVWKTQVTTPKATYTRVADLQSDRDYTIIITASTGATSPEGTSFAPTLTPLTADQVKTVEASVAQIKALHLASDANALALASLYQSNRLNQDAIDVLEAQIKAGTSNTSIYQLQANLYQQIGLNQLAQTRYREALKLAETHRNLMQQAEIQEQLGYIARGQEDFAQAVERLQRAEKLYQELFDPAAPDAQVKLQIKLQKLQQAIEDSQARLATS